VVALAGLSVSAYAQAPPPGSYTQSCRDIRIQGTTLTAVCRRASGPDNRWSEAEAFQEHCERLRSAEHQIRDRLAYTPYGEEREQLQYRLGQIHQEGEPCRRGRP
jgi:hypothetical protein